MKIKGIDTRKMLAKDEEIAILGALYEAFKGTGNYLEKLFTPAMLATCTQNIKDDFLPDIEGSRQMEHDEMVRLNAKCNELKRILAEKQDKIVQLEQKVKDLQGTIRDTQSAWADACEREAKLERELDKVRRFRVSLKDLLAED